MFDDFVNKKSFIFLGMWDGVLRRHMLSGPVSPCSATRVPSAGMARCIFKMAKQRLPSYMLFPNVTWTLLPLRDRSPLESEWA